ncbi:MAG: hypothetical protein K2P58_01640 [Hyphomonadaceae bacterium]|nr:hypothetical protein [Hyphomonadaceae bacterium]
MNGLMPPKRGGAGGVALVLCASAALLGVGLDFLQRHPDPFWIGASPGGAAAIGAAAALFCLAVARLAHAFLHRKRSD